MSKLVVGQEVYLQPVNNAARVSKKIITTTVKTIGRKYFTVDDEDTYWSRMKFDLEEMREHSNYSPEYYVYLSLEDAENSIKRPEKAEMWLLEYQHYHILNY